jgi:hypothetical protein
LKEQFNPNPLISAFDPDESEAFLESYKKIIDNQSGLKREDGVEIKLANRLFAAQGLNLVQNHCLFKRSTLKSCQKV